MIPWPRHPAFDTPLSAMDGISKPALAFLEKKGITTAKDLLERAPLRYQDRREPQPLSSARNGESIFFTCTATGLSERRARSGRTYLRCTVEDLSGLGARGLLMFFRGTAYIGRYLGDGTRLAVLGTPTFQTDWSAGRSSGAVATFSHPEFWNLSQISLDNLLGVFPVYGTWKRLTPGLRKVLIQTILKTMKDAPDVLPAGFAASRGLKDPVELVRILHSPPAAPGGRIPRSARDTRTYRSLAVMELVFWRLMALREKGRRRALTAPRPHEGAKDLGDDFTAMLPYELSPEQRRVLGEIRGMISLPSPASVLLQGEVGSGKTAVAAALLFRTAGLGRQAALVAPTDLLARQHFDFLLPYAQRLGVGIELFAGSNPASKRKKTVSALAAGDIRIAVGTQALLFPRLAFRDLALAVVDEQHRFGVKQRLALREKSPLADLVSMSATPIPRSLALAFYGETDVVSIAGTLPGRRQPDVEVYLPDRAEEAYARFATLLRSGERGFLVSPRIGDDEASDDGTDEEARDGGAAEDAPDGSRGSRGPSVEEMRRRLEAAAPDLSAGVVHGRVDQLSRSKVMEEFRQGRLKCLVSTTIVEVGVDIPGVNVMLIEGAENMGLAQLHQLRGRLGRGGGAGALLLLAHGVPSDNANRRFEALKSGADGYALAELDLTLRGPGDNLGLKQSGWPEFSFAKFPDDFRHLPQAMALADDLYAMRGEFSSDLADA
ncbi:MAG: DEAD/DEAH box helicase, partial [Deltaproteobacteria bacterium]|nr:DEAD/DEAH box helicase [Deltaproteobacteria bacterium]